MLVIIVHLANWIALLLQRVLVSDKQGNGEAAEDGAHGGSRPSPLLALVRTEARGE
jgi:hypothetical protein